MPAMTVDWNSLSTRPGRLFDPAPRLPLVASAHGRYHSPMRFDYSDSNVELGLLYPSHLETVRTRHDEALDKAGAAHAVVFSGAPHPVFLDDTHYPFRCNAHFSAWAPLTRLPLSFVVHTPGEKPVLIYHQPKDYWHVVPGDPEGYWTAYFDIRIVHTLEDAVAELPEARNKCVLIGEVGEIGEIGETGDPAHAFGIERVNPATVLNSLHYARGVKTEYELACMRLASRRAAGGHLAAAAAFRNGAPEFEIHRAYCGAADHTDNELPYDNIVALNEHAAVLHYTNLDRKSPVPMRSFLIDAGAQVHAYAADITRSYSNGDPEYDALLGRVETLQRTIVGRVAAGVDFRDLHFDTHRLLAALLIDAGLARGSADSLLESGVTSVFLPHGLGHLLGIQVHDVGGHMADDNGATIETPAGHPYLRLTRVLVEDMVLTIEPGIYFIDMLLETLRGTPAEKQVDWKAVDRLRPFGGIRIEDNVRVLADGSENLTRDAFADLAG